MLHNIDVDKRSCDLTFRHLYNSVDCDSNVIENTASKKTYWNSGFQLINMTQTSSQFYVEINSQSFDFNDCILINFPLFYSCFVVPATK